MNRYTDEARERWGDTDAYHESERRAAGALRRAVKESSATGWTPSWRALPS